MGCGRRAPSFVVLDCSVQPGRARRQIPSEDDSGRDWGMMESKYRVEENAFFDWYTGYLKELSKSRRFNPERELRLSSWEYADLYFAKVGHQSIWSKKN